ncbi:GH1 family beta-glucosidase [Sphingomonas nostoxanthinifaciens]|uniref:GH1 family beta-glucosidase n=1 Tax=Sphingomonas nostoxanthinifaciens TaxID=2872652 RepID=UPI001CC1D453|nr:GH1 family beta-glucosidase [Sphingomonas nostoxanthinifaciens]UAK23044.1 beta-glucosidase [Sphingomonas nostoxanthinifaciens]
MAQFNRRDIGKGLGLAATTLGMPAAARAAMPRDASFPSDFQWGCATASYQIEGAVNEDGRGPTIWDTFSHTPGKVANGENGDVACDSYHRYAEDIALLKAMGVRTYRMSVAWSRIFPEGRGKPNPKGLDYYNRVVDGLLAAGIEPYVTTFHWDLPQALPGGWQNRDTAYALGDYAGYLAKSLGDRVHNFMTVNELRCFTDIGHIEGRHAPGLKLLPAQGNQVRHHGVLAHGLAVQAIRANARPGTRIGLADNTSFFVPVIETPEHIEAVRRATREENAMFLTAIMEGKYLDSYLAEQGAAAPKVQAGDMKIISSPLDFVAINVYTPSYVRSDSGPKGYKILPHLPQSPRMASPWLYVGPEVGYWSVRMVSELWKPKALYISENGCSADDVMADGRLDDADRVMYLRNYMTHFQRAVAEGYPLKGYFLWSLMDNFEWADGYSKRFGVHYVDFATQKRTPKLSAAWYRELIRRNALV